MGKEIVYCMTTIVPGLVKIGRTTDYNKRMKLLEKNGYCNVTGLKKFYAIEVKNCKIVEEELHKMFSKQQVGATELFACDPNDVANIMLKKGKVIFSFYGDENETRNMVKSNRGISKIPNNNCYYLFYNKEKIASIKINNNNIILCKGSRISPIKTKSLKYKSLEEWEKINKKYVKNGILKRDYPFKSLSIASSVVLGYPSNGWTDWKNDQNKSVSIYR